MNMINGIHHVTALASDPQQNYDFYTKVLGLRLVKKTVNFDDPSVYHFYFGNGQGDPGTILTFFPYGHILRGKRGQGEAGALSFTVPTGTLDQWILHLDVHGVKVLPDSVLFGNRVVSFLDPDGMKIELEEEEFSGVGGTWQSPSVPSSMAVIRINRVTLVPSPRGPIGEYDSTESALNDLLGFERLGRDGQTTRFKTGSCFVDVINRTDLGPMRSSAGTIHHIAFRNPNDEAQAEWREKLVQAQFHVSPVMDRSYFHSIYFREPGGVLFELATDNPGFATDEPADLLGTMLSLPTQFEPERERIERLLVPIASGTSQGGATQ